MQSAFPARSGPIETGRNSTEKSSLKRSPSPSRRHSASSSSTESNLQHRATRNPPPNTTPPSDVSQRLRSRAELGEEEPRDSATGWRLSARCQREASIAPVADAAVHGDYVRVTHLL